MRDNKKVSYTVCYMKRPKRLRFHLEGTAVELKRAIADALGMRMFFLKYEVDGYPLEVLNDDHATMEDLNICDGARILVSRDDSIPDALVEHVMRLPGYPPGDLDLRTASYSGGSEFSRDNRHMKAYRWLQLGIKGRYPGGRWLTEWPSAYISVDPARLGRIRNARTLHQCFDTHSCTRIQTFRDPREAEARTTPFNCPRGGRYKFMYLVRARPDTISENPDFPQGGAWLHDSHKDLRVCAILTKNLHTSRRNEDRHES